MAVNAEEHTDSPLARLLADARFELMPFQSFDGELEELPEMAEIAVTTSPQLGIETTIEQSVAAAAAGYRVVPHIAARYVEGPQQLRWIIDSLDEAGIEDVFVPGGDREDPDGPYESALDLLVAMDDIGHPFEDVGITGYPEGHAFIDDATLRSSMAAKAPYATYIVTQLCYDTETIVDWIDSVREAGIDLPIEVGIPGVMNYQKLLKISAKVGVGDSVRFLRKTTGIVDTIRQVIGSRGVYTPDDLVEGLATVADDAHYDLRGLHIYTFNNTEDLEAWRQQRLAEH
jgi:methylenetetrahydrofolate reductase (NADPH)